jgi:hypothetical protein
MSDPIILGIFGTVKIPENEVQDILTLILQELRRMPDIILIPTEGNSSIYIQDWAESLRIKTQIFHSDWVKNGKIAQIIRDNRIAKECSHALVFIKSNTGSTLSKLSKLSKLSETLCRKGKIVFTFDQVLEQLESVPLVSKPARKSNIERGQMLLKFQTKAKC